MGAALGVILKWAFTHWRLAAGIGVIVLIAGAGWYIQHLRASVDAAQTQAATAALRAQANAQAVGVMRSELQRRARIHQQLQQWQQQTQQRYGRLRHDIQQQIQTSSAALRACLDVHVDRGLLDRLRRGAADPDPAHPATE